LGANIEGTFLTLPQPFLFNILRKPSELIFYKPMGRFVKTLAPMREVNYYLWRSADDTGTQGIWAKILRYEKIMLESARSIFQEFEKAKHCEG
jgi:hypothetical protein